MFAPTGEVIVAAGDKGGKDATARLRKTVADRSRAGRTPSSSSARRDEARAVDQKVEDLRRRHGRGAAPASASGSRSRPQGLKDELRKVRDELERPQADA